MTRKRYCVIKARSTADILDVCNRHISNINKTAADLITEGDGTSSDFWYIDMFRSTWTDLRDDVEALLKKEPKK